MGKYETKFHEGGALTISVGGCRNWKNDAQNTELNL